MAVVSHAVNMILMRAGHSIPLAREIKIESRVKAVDSILLKMLSTRTAWPNYESIEDIAGVRVICPTHAYSNESGHLFQFKADTHSN